MVTWHDSKNVIEVYLYEVRVHPVCEGFLLHSLILTCGGWREGGREKEEEKGKRGGEAERKRVGYRKWGEIEGGGIGRKKKKWESCSYFKAWFIGPVMWGEGSGSWLATHNWEKNTKYWNTEKPLKLKRYEKWLNTKMMKSLKPTPFMYTYWHTGSYQPLSQTHTLC